MSLDRKLESGLSKNKVGVTNGPRVTRFELLPQKGLNIKGYKRFENNFQAALRAEKIGIYIPIPGTNVVGIEVPNKSPYMVNLRGMLEAKSYLANRHNLYIPLGVDVQGKPIHADLTKMPHMLAAGTTGSGKSVFLNVNGKLIDIR
ncbi:DNA translocase FtsK [Aneurinibacillus migulanus]|uniref:FtsK/SpoIIIE family protein n=1 Tax=Aneurinibacillus migulanus TaxID=47500 RepID=A0A0D1XPI2_ANEMI|nr:DNA translocase FtsK [Aneurinibacillus migulanus]KIV54103.1 hypothetical protein TS65_19380 [Aneurinibacillus migulanus]KON97624.1 hypothetical protein AF333_21420 [Aneurinibacillus migulanus]MED0895422.1 DNA translocase FtsK [Aneurinibacillus migulanus]MED1619684.1 DNA translocase FtsK [Aneurinibacillus migulanus]SDJ37572.1 FtsK/SpoIIIE family protein [Aneurinibacillus migulanus]